MIAPPIEPDEKHAVTTLRRIETTLSRTHLPTFRACGLSETDARTVIDRGWVEIYSTADQGPVLDIYIIKGFSTDGLAILAKASVDPSQTSRTGAEDGGKSKSPWLTAGGRRIAADLIKVAVGIVIGASATWFMLRY